MFSVPHLKVLTAKLANLETHTFLMIITNVKAFDPIIRLSLLLKRNKGFFLGNMRRPLDSLNICTKYLQKFLWRHCNFGYLQVMVKTYI